MNYQMEVMEKNHIVRAVISGDVTLSDVLSVAEEGRKLAEKENCTRYLIDIVQINIRYSIFESIEFINKLTKMGFTRKEKVAFIIKTGDKEHHHWTTFAANRGWGNIAYFTSRKDAKEWLEKGWE